MFVLASLPGCLLLEPLSGCRRESSASSATKSRKTDRNFLLISDFLPRQVFPVINKGKQNPIIRLVVTRTEAWAGWDSK